MTILFSVGFPVLVVKSPPANAGDRRNAGSILELGRSSGVGGGNPLQYSHLENTMDRNLACYSPWDCKEADAAEHTFQYYMFCLIPCEICLYFLSDFYYFASLVKLNIFIFFFRYFYYFKLLSSSLCNSCWLLLIVICFLLWCCSCMGLFGLWESLMPRVVKGSLQSTYTFVSARVLWLLKIWEHL